MNQMKMVRPTPWWQWPRYVPWSHPFDLSTDPHSPYLLYHWWAIMIAPHENSDGKCNGRDNSKDTTIFWWNGKCEEAGKDKGLMAERGCEPILDPPPSSFTLQHPDWSSENPTTVFAMPTLWAHLHRSTQNEAVRIPLLSSLCPHSKLICTAAPRWRQQESHCCLHHAYIPASPVTLAVWSSVIPTAASAIPTPYNISVWGQHPGRRQCNTQHCLHCAHALFHCTYTIPQPPSCNSCMLPVPLLSKVNRLLLLDIYHLMHAMMTYPT